MDPSRGLGRKSFLPQVKSLSCPGGDQAIANASPIAEVQGSPSSIDKMGWGEDLF